eukprot:6194324-Pleurochrysis_carterae.AAC.6
MGLYAVHVKECLVKLISFSTASPCERSRLCIAAQYGHPRNSAREGREVAVIPRRWRAGAAWRGSVSPRWRASPAQRS